MANDDIVIVSSTDSPEDVQAALTGTPVAPKADDAAAKAAAAKAAADATAKAAADKAAADKAAADKAAADATAKPAAGDPPPPAEETTEQRIERERAKSHDRRVNKIQERIDAATAKRRQAEREAEAEEQRLATLRAEAAALDAKLKATPAAAPAAPAAVAPKLDDVDAAGKPKYANYEEWVSANAQFHAEQAAAKVAAKTEETEARITKKQTEADRARIEHETALREEQEALASYQTKLEAFRSSTPDFDAIYESGKEFVAELVEDLGPDAMNVMNRFTLHDADNGPAITHHLLKNPDEMRRIAALPVPQQIAALARLDARLEAATKEPARPPVAPVTQAPEPIKPVGSTPTASTVSPDEEDYRTYAARRNEEERKRLVAR